MASSWPRSRDAGLVGRLTVGDITENKSREGIGKWRKQTMHISHKPTHKHRIKSSGCCGSTHYNTTLHVHFAHTHTHTWGSHVKYMKRTTKLAEKYKHTPTYFSTLSHVLEKERTAGPCRQSPFFSFPVVVGVWLGTWVLQSFGGRSLFCWIRNIWSIWGPCPCSTLKERPIHLDPLQLARVLGSHLLTARQNGSNTPALDLIM